MQGGDDAPGPLGPCAGGLGAGSGDWSRGGGLHEADLRRRGMVAEGGVTCQKVMVFSQCAKKSGRRTEAGAGRDRPGRRSASPELVNRS